MSAVERDDSDVGLHSRGERADLILKTQRARAAERGREESIFRRNRGPSPILREVSYRFVFRRECRALAPRANAPIQTRQQGCEVPFFNNVAGIVAGD